ncbi:glycosyltransferase family 1 protein [soil metagenome]
MRRVGVNLLWLVPGVVGGSEEYTTRLLRGVAEKAPPDLALTLFVLRPFLAAHPELSAAHRTVVLGLSGRNKVARVAAESTWLASESRRRGVELMHHAGGILPTVRTAPAVLTIHDLQPLVLPENFSPLKRTFARTMVPRSARAARLVVTPSEHARRSVISRLGVAPGRVRVVPHGIDPAEAARRPGRTGAEVRARYRLAGPFFLFPAITYPPKNHLVLVRAFARLAKAEPTALLVLPGAAGPAEEALTAEIDRLDVADRVRRLGRIPWSDLDTLYREAAALTFPSRFEGFVAPVLEAMSRGCPVLAADATALPEVVGDAGLLLPPDDSEEWCRAMIAVLDDAERRRRAGSAGLARAAEFGWGRAAGALLNAYRTAFDGPSLDGPSLDGPA